ncbi:MAG TPA: cation-transporting P-type ATPase [Chloroflexota bacterium]|nr:cation-transporting P-type ATPase [Chloroflexota bacterium]
MAERASVPAAVDLEEPSPREPGLSSTEVRRRVEEFGPNRLVPVARRPPLVAWLLRPLADPMVLLLLVAGSTYLSLGELVDAVVTLVALVPIMLVTFVLEARAERTLEQLGRLTAPTATVWRDGRRQKVRVEELVPGDVVFIREGDVVPADGVLFEGRQLMLDESSLTGESEPVPKDAKAEPGDRDVWAGTTVLSGRGIARIVATGHHTRLGRIGTLVAEIHQPETPLQRVIRRLVWQLAGVAVIFCVGVFVIELVRGNGWSAAIIAAVSLAIAAVPEEFPMVFTLYLTLGAWRLAKDNALIRRMVGVETLGSTTVICADKTGTLTLGHLEVVALATEEGETMAAGEVGTGARALLESAVLASEPRPFDPLEQAILRCARLHGIEVAGLHGRHLLHDYPFDPDGKYVTHVWGDDDGATYVCAKGAVEGILARSQASTAARRAALTAMGSLADRGMRVIGVAGGPLDAPSGDRARDEVALRFLGLVAFSDPLRPGVAQALRECQSAGIRVLMITGDHPVTAHAVAESLGLVHDDRQPIVTGEMLDRADDDAWRRLARVGSIFARVRPEQKYRLVRVLRAQGEVVAMTGDGINDAPALREADIGVAMGQRGTEVARAAATLVLLDDNFATIVAAVRDGRRIFENLQRAFNYLLAFHVPILLAAFILPFAGLPLFLLPIHLVLLELVLHPIVALVFENDPPSRDLMARPPRPRSAGFLAGADWLTWLGHGAVLFAGVLVVFVGQLSAGAPVPSARALAFVTLVLGQLVLLVLARSPIEPVWRSGLRSNRSLPIIGAIVVATLVAAVVVPLVADTLELATLSAADWLLAMLVALGTTLWREPWKALRPASRST